VSSYTSDATAWPRRQPGVHEFVHAFENLSN
jgi:hypothetical protein